jgi:integrase
LGGTPGQRGDSGTGMAKRRRRIRSPHPGVKLNARVLPSGRTQWRARFTDPDTGRKTDVTLDPVALPTHEARRLWAVRKAQSIAKEHMEVASGAPRSNAKPLADALNAFRESAALRLRRKTIVTYELAIARLLTWAERSGIESTADLTRVRLAHFRAYLVAAPCKTAKRGGTRGARKETARKRSPVSINVELRSSKTLLNAWRVAGLLPHLDRDAIGDALKLLPVPREQPEFLAPAKLQKLLRAALRHDTAVFAETRQEHAGLKPLGTTVRYEPISFFTTFLLLTGCRRGEALGLTWDDVDLDAVDSQGHVVGEIRLKAAATKTKRARTIGLEVSPALRSLLAAMKLRAASDVAAGLRVFGGATHYTADLVATARQRLIREYGAPDFDWQTLRSTCATFLTNAPGIFGAATVFMSARQLGHSVTVAERHYLGVHRGIPHDARTLEAAMQIEDLARDAIAAASGNAIERNEFPRALPFPRTAP